MNPLSRTKPTVFLRAILEAKGRSFLYLSRPDRSHIAVIIPLSVIQLHGGLWLLNNLTNRDIHLFVGTGKELALSCGDPHPGATSPYCPHR